jgi:hypothetical protein
LCKELPELENRPTKLQKANEKIEKLKSVISKHEELDKLILKAYDGVSEE